MTRGQHFETMCGKDEWTAIPSAAALRAAVFALSAKNLRGGGNQLPPPPGVRVLMRLQRGGAMTAERAAPSPHPDGRPLGADKAAAKSSLRPRTAR